MTSAGRVLPANPKSTSHTSPRLGVGIFLIEGFEQSSRGSADFFIPQRARIERQRTAQYLVGEGALLVSRQMIERFEQSLGLAGHSSIIAGVFGVTKASGRAGAFGQR